MITRAKLILFIVANDIKSAQFSQIRFRKILFLFFFFFCSFEQSEPKFVAVSVEWLFGTQRYILWFAMLFKLWDSRIYMFASHFIFHLLLLNAVGKYFRAISHEP